MRLKFIFLIRLTAYIILFHGVLAETGPWTVIAIGLPLTLAELHIVRIRLILEQMLQDGQINE